MSICHVANKTKVCTFVVVALNLDLTLTLTCAHGTADTCTKADDAGRSGDQADYIIHTRPALISRALAFASRVIREQLNFDY